ncbi:MAG: MerR family transcriptional regulator [Bacillota bacterium]|nr:MerR family transcriptional regulator [Bacillota bacterium]
MKEIYYKIGEAAEMLGVEQYTLRYLETTLKLKIKRDERSDRIYSEEDIDTLRLILQLKNEKGLNTTAIKMALENMEESHEANIVPSEYDTSLEQITGFTNRIIEQNNELLSQNKRLTEQISHLDDKLSRLEARRSDRLDELISLWRNEQDDRNKSWLSRLKRK